MDSSGCCCFGFVWEVLSFLGSIPWLQAVRGCHRDLLMEGGNREKGDECGCFD